MTQSSIILADQLQAFITRMNMSTHPWGGNAWLQEDGYELYVRKSVRLCQGRVLHCLDLASSEIPEGKRGRGWFKSLLTWAIENHPWDAVYLESVANKRLAEFLRNQGYYEIAEFEQSSFFCFRKNSS